MQSAVAFLIYNRPEITARTFAAIRNAEPPRLLVVADGPRQEEKTDAQRCAETRALISDIDWPCLVEWNAADRNLGCARRVSSGLDWVFNRVEEAIILEDDCLPDASFFRFCDELLERYRDDSRVVVISGDNFQNGRRVSRHSYYFSAFNHIWGWATWRRAWSQFDFDMKDWARERDGGLLERLWPGQPGVAAYWANFFGMTARGEIDTWDCRWTFACWAAGGLTVLPEVNLVSNIGFGPDATHTKDVGSPVGGLRAYSIEFPLSHPRKVEREMKADVRSAYETFGVPRQRSWPRQLLSKMAGVARKVVS